MRHTHKKSRINFEFKGTFLSNLNTGHSRLAGWYHDPLGQALAHAEQEYINRVLPDLFGYHLLQIGDHKSLRWLRQSRIRHQIGIAVDEVGHHAGSWVRGWYDSLPFRSDSIDVLVLPHTLEFSVSPQRVLEEATRILLPEGHLLIFGFNPYSMWGIRRIFRRRDGSVPWRGQFLSAGRVEQWLTELGCTTVRCDTLFFRPPITNKYWIEHFSFLEKFGQRFLPHTGAVYLLQVKKQVTTLTPIKPRWSLQEYFNTKSLTEPTTRKAGVTRDHAS